MTSFQRNILLILAFLITRIYLAFWFISPLSDTGIYFGYASDFHKARQNNISFYEQCSEITEYPPMAILWMSLPVLFSPGDAPSALTWDFVFKLRYLLFDLAIFAFLFFFLVRPGSKLQVSEMGLTLYIITGILLCNFLYERMDLWLAGFIFFSVLLLFSRYHWSWSFVVLAAGINFKIIPVVVIPVMLLGSLPAKNGFVFNRLMIINLFKRGIILLTITCLLFLPFYWWGGRDTLEFTRFHSVRGLQLESLYSSIILFTGFKTNVKYEYGSYNLESAVSDFLAGISPIIMLLSVFFIVYLLIRQFSDWSNVKNDNKELSDSNLAQCMPQTFLLTIIATLLFSMIFSKVLSPQYLLWILPLLALVRFKKKYSMLAGIAFMLACALTTAIYPYLYFTDFLHDEITMNDGTVTWGSPTPLATVILFIRNSLLILSAIMVVVSMIKESKTEIAEL